MLNNQILKSKITAEIVERKSCMSFDLGCVLKIFEIIVLKKSICRWIYAFR